MIYIRFDYSDIREVVEIPSEKAENVYALESKATAKRFVSKLPLFS